MSNLFANIPAVVVAKITATFGSAGISSLNTFIIYEVGNPLKSYQPGRSINAINSFTAGKGYYIVPKIDMDLSAVLLPPAPTPEASSYIMSKRTEDVTDFVRDGSMAMQLGNYIYSFGGWTDNGGEVTYNDVYRSTDNLTSWEKMPNAPWHSRHVFGCVKKDAKVWVLGGDNLNPSFDVWNSSNGTDWDQVGTANPISQLTNRIYSAICGHKDGDTEFIYVIGGYGFSDVLRTADGINWEIVASNVALLKTTEYPSGSGMSGAAVSFGGNIYLICGGGSISDGPPKKSVLISQDHGVTWRALAEFPGEPRRYTNTCVFDNKLWVVGGYNDNTVGNLADIWYMNLAGVWTEFVTPSDYLGRHATAVEVFNESLVITCGNYYNDCWVIDKQ